MEERPSRGSLAYMAECFRLKISASLPTGEDAKALEDLVKVIQYRLARAKMREERDASRGS